MLTKQENDLLTDVGPGTAMGELLRRYWHPIAAEAELETKPIKEIRIFTEDLVLYRDLSGTYGLIDRRCPHRCANLANGIVETSGIRCSYHGWKFDRNGACTEQPFEETTHPAGRFKTAIAVKAYPVVAKAGIVWAYLGPSPAPCLMDWDYFHRRGFKLVRMARIPCNWLQCQENTIDPVHFEWLHENWSLRLRGELGRYSPKHQRLRFEEFEYGFVYGRIRDGSDEQNPLWSVGRACLWPNGFVTHSFSWLVPIDTHATLLIHLHNFPIPGDREFCQRRIPFLYESLDDVTSIDVLAGMVNDHGSSIAQVNRSTLRQDVLAMLGQGVVADRTGEHLGESDRGIILLRKRLFAELELVAAGKDPKAILRDPAANVRLPVPFIEGNASHTDPIEYFGTALSPQIVAEIAETWGQLAAR